MTERPILFSGPMVLALLAGRKTQTRRVVNPQPDCLMPVEGRQWPMREVPWPADGRYDIGYQAARGDGKLFQVIPSPCGQPGDLLWVREAWRCPASLDAMDASGIAKAAALAGWDNPWAPIKYEADGALSNAQEWREFGSHPGEATPGRYRHGRFMPRWACRLVLEVSAVRVERLQEISTADVDAEGLDTHSAWGLTGASSKITAKPEHWINGHDEGESYCRACAEKKIKELAAASPEEEFLLDGGWRTEGDSQAFCETCQCYLDNSYTDYCCGSELDHFEANGFDVNSPSDCYALDNVLAASLWTGGKHSDRLRRLCYRALWESLNAKRGHGWDKNPFVWAVSARRTAAPLAPSERNERRELA